MGSPELACGLWPVGGGLWAAVACVETWAVVVVACATMHHDPCCMPCPSSTPFPNPSYQKSTLAPRGLGFCDVGRRFLRSLALLSLLLPSSLSVPTARPTEHPSHAHPSAAIIAAAIVTITASASAPTPAIHHLPCVCVARSAPSTVASQPSACYPVSSPRVSRMPFARSPAPNFD